MHEFGHKMKALPKLSKRLDVSEVGSNQLCELESQLRGEALQHAGMECSCDASQLGMGELARDLAMRRHEKQLSRGYAKGMLDLGRTMRGKMRSLYPNLPTNI